MAGRKALAVSQAVELVLEGRAILIMSEELCKHRATIDKLDDIRREDIINKEDYFFRCGLAHLKDGRLEDLKALLVWFEKVKRKDRELLLHYEELDDQALQKELERFKNGHQYFGDEANKLELLAIEENLKVTKNKKVQDCSPTHGVL